MYPAYKSDVKKHLSLQIKKHILPVQPIPESDESGYGRDESRSETGNQVHSGSNWDRRLSSARAPITSTPIGPSIATRNAVGMKQHAIFLRAQCQLPSGLGLIQKQFCELWLSVEDTTAFALETKVRNTGWHFMWLMEAYFCRGIGRTAESARRRAITLALSKVKKRFNAAELGLVTFTKYPGFQVARIILHARLIQEHASLDRGEAVALREIPAH